MNDVPKRLMLGKLQNKVIKTIKKLSRGQVLLTNRLKSMHVQLSNYLRKSTIDIESKDTYYMFLMIRSFKKWSFFNLNDINDIISILEKKSVNFIIYNIIF